MSRGSPNQRKMMEGGTLNRSGMVEQFEAMKEDYDALRQRYAELMASHAGTVHQLELAKEELSHIKPLHDTASKERSVYKQQCTSAIRQWDTALKERTEYKESLAKLQQQHDEAMKEINQSMVQKIKANKEIKRLTEESQAAHQEYALIMSERDSVHRELEKLTDDLAGSKKQIKNLETINKELQEKLAAAEGEASKEADVAKMRRDWAFSERHKIVQERESLRILCDRLRKERDRAVSDLAEALSESEDIRKQKNLASKQLKELRDKMEFEKENHQALRVQQYFSNSSSFSESRDSAIDSDMPSGHYSIKLPNGRGADHGLVLEPGVYINRIIPGSPASKEVNLNVGDRVLFINDAPIDNVQDAILALSEDIDPIVLTLSRSAGHLSSPISASNAPNRNKNLLHPSKASAHASSSSLRSDKSDPNSVLSDGRRQAGGGSKSGSGGLRDIFRVRLPRKKSSPEEEILATLDTLDSAIASGAGGGGGASRKKRNKRVSSSRNSGTENMGTWPRMMSRNSYTLPKDGGVSSGSRAPTDKNSPSTNHYRETSSYYGQYMPMGGSGSGNMTSNTVCVRRPSSGKDRVPLSNMLWDLQPPHPSKSVGAISMGGGGGGGGMNNYGYNTKSLTLAGHTRPGSGGFLLDNHGLPTPGSMPHYRYSFGVFDPTPSSSKLGKGPERNSVVPAISDGSSIDFSVKSGNMEILEYYVNKRQMVKHQNNSSESDHLDKVVMPPSLGMGNTAKSNTMSNLIGGHSSIPSNVSGTSTLDGRYHNNPYSSPYAGHYHELLGGGGPTMSSSNSGTLPLSIPKPSNSSYAFEPSSLHYSHSHGNKESSMSMSHGSSSGTRLNFRNSDDLLLQPSYQIEPSGTFPRNREPHRIRIPSNQSSRSSTEKVDLRNSPMPTYHIQAGPKRRITVLDPGAGSAGAGEYGIWPRKPAPGELRMIRIDKYDKSTEFLGIQISCNANGGGVFVSHVTDNSLASQVGLQIGDQLLEVCGINMRIATYDLAAKVLRESGDPLTLLVQYTPEKYCVHDNDRATSSEEDEDGESSSSPDNDDHNSSTTDSRSGSRSGSPTPCNSPQSTLVRNSKKNSSVQHKHSLSASNATDRSLPKKSSGHSSANNSLPKSKNSQQSSTQSNGLSQAQQQQIKQAFALSGVTQDRGDRGGGGGDRGDRDPPSEQSTLRSTRSSGGASSAVGVGGADGGEGKMLLQDQTRFLTLQLMKNSSNLGICLVGGNLVGIYVHSVQTDSVADRAGLRTGDQIKEYNGTDLRHATAEEAAFELAKPLNKVGILVQYNLQRYNDVKDKPGDGFYIRALFDYPALSSDHHHQASSVDPQQLTFLKDEILYVDNTMYNGKPGRWRAWKVDAEGHTRVWGIIPSKYKVEEDMLFKRSLGDLDGDRRSSTVTRRSFFRRKSHHRSSSRELASFSDFSINSYGDLAGQHGLPMKDDSILPLTSYQRVERLDYMNFLRPVILVGALSDLIAERLVQDFPYQFAKVIPEFMRCDGPMLQDGLTKNLFLDKMNENKIVDYKRKGSHYECVTMTAIHEVRSKKLYCIMDISTSGVERLLQSQMYPIVLLIKFKNPKQIREIKDLSIKDLRCDKISQKAAKELYEHSLKVENEYKHVITACVPGGTNISYLATQAKTAVEKEQSKTLWVPI
ncbi:disks large homolog 5 isoform X3 [Folsomia candida]|uniref:disks large homolog 5 isoform X3 n=1 Tax=Folsomia candida TaxID=158441 RepID=UPI000B904E75|nr:disks large homolog 5 isoform X3 [Folsomia candida]